MIELTNITNRKTQVDLLRCFYDGYFYRYTSGRVTIDNGTVIMSGEMCNISKELL